MNFKFGENDISADDIVALNQLLKQLNPLAPIVDLKKVRRVEQRGGIIITIRNDSGLLVGMGTLIPIQKLFASCGTVEDVVIDKSCRGNGLGKKLMGHIIKKGQKLDLQFIDLTSSPQRVEANGLYKSIGFQKKETNFYTFHF